MQEPANTTPLALHREWMMEGWERRDGDPPFVFEDRMGRFYDLGDPAGIYWDNFAPGETHLFDNALTYGRNWEGLQNEARSILHALTGGETELVGDDVASTTLGFTGLLTRLDGEVLAFEGRSQLGWKRVAGAWRIAQELNYAWVVDPSEIRHRYRT